MWKPVERLGHYDALKGQRIGEIERALVCLRPEYFDSRILHLAERREASPLNIMPVEKKARVMAL